MIASSKAAIKSFGWVNGFLYLLNRVFIKISKEKAKLSKFYLYVQPISKEPLLPKRKLEAYALLELGQNNIDINIFGRPPEVIRQRYKQGDECIGCFKKDELIGYIWYAFDEYYEDVVRCIYYPKPKHLCCWDYDIYVEPKYRIGFVFLALWDALNKKLISQGYTHSMSRISAFAVDSIKSHERLGAKRIGTLFFISIFDFQVMISNKKPYFHFSFGKEVSPKVIVNMPNRQ